MKRFTFIYNCIILSIVLVLGVMYLSKIFLCISFINDDIYLYLLIAIPLMITFYPYWGGFGVGLLSLVWRGVAAISILSITFLVAFSQNGLGANYAYMKSPSQEQEIVIKQYITGLHHFTNNIEIYKRVGIFFKEDIKNAIYIDEDKVGLSGRVEIIDGSKFEGKEEYTIDNQLIFRWIDDETLELYYQGPQEKNGKKISIQKTIDL